MKIRPIGAELFLEDIQMDRRGDMTKLIVAVCYSFDRNALLYPNPHFLIRSTIRNITFQNQEHFFPPGATQPTVGVYFTALYRALASSRTRLLDLTQRPVTVGRNPLNE